MLSNAIGQGLFPGAALSVWHKGDIVYRHYAGKRTFVPWARDIDACSIFDLASLTKPLVTALAYMLLRDRAMVCLEDNISTFFKDVCGDISDISLELLLCHASGLPAHKRLFENRRLAALPSGPERIDAACGLILCMPLIYAPGTISVYSDLGYILLGRIVEKITGRGLFEFVSDEIFYPIGLDGLYWQNSSDLPIQASVPSGYCPFRHKVLVGEVHDTNSWFLGGTTGHAGLFGTLEAVEQLLFVLTRAYFGLDTPLPISQETIAVFFHGGKCGPRSTWRLGFDSPSATDSTAGSFFSVNSIGHLGYTGTSFWIDLDGDIAVVFLSNRTFPYDSPASVKEMKVFRKRLHDTIRSGLATGM